MFVSDNLPEPNLTTMRAGGFLDSQFDGEPWFGKSDTRGIEDDDPDHG